MTTLAIDIIKLDYNIKMPDLNSSYSIQLEWRLHIRRSPIRGKGIEVLFEVKSRTVIVCHLQIRSARICTIPSTCLQISVGDCGAKAYLIGSQTVIHRLSQKVSLNPIKRIAKLLSQR